MESKTVNNEEEIRPRENLLDELAYEAIDKADGDEDKAIDDFLSFAIFLPSNSEPLTKEESEEIDKRLKILEEINRKLEEEFRQNMKIFNKMMAGVEGWN